MKTMKSLPLLFLCTLSLQGQSAKAAGSDLSMQELLSKALAGPEVRSAAAEAETAMDKEKSTWRKIFVPKLSGGITYGRLLSDQGIQLPPLGGMAIPPMKLEPNMWSGNLALQQAIFDPSTMLYRGPAANRQALAAQLESNRQGKETQAKTIELYLNALELRAKRKALETYAENLNSRSREIRRIFELGGLAEGDLLKIKLGIEDANQGARDLQNGEVFTGEMIASLIGEASPVHPTELPDELPPSATCANGNSISDREDIQAIDANLAALDLAERGNRFEYLPKVYGVLQGNYSNLNLLTNSTYLSLGLQLSWSIFDGGSNFAEANALASQNQSLQQKRELALSSARAALNNATEALKIKRQEYEERRRTVLDARRVADLEFKRLRNGKTTINNLIDAEDTLKDRNEKASLSKISWYQAWFKCQLASGSAMSVP